MATDATVLLIRRISTQSGPEATAQASTTSLLSEVNSVVSNAASYAQLLSTAEGPAAQALADSTVSNAAATATEGGAIDEALAAEAAGPAALSGAETAGIGAAVVLIISFIVAFLSARSSGSGSTETEQLNELQNIVGNLEDTEEAVWWQTRITDIMSSWNSANGGIGTDLDNLSIEGTRGIDVKNDVSKFHDHAAGFVNQFIPSLTPGAEIYWERPIDQSQIFSSQTVVYAYPILTIDGYGDFPGQIKGVIMSWYGNPQPQPQAAPPLGGSAQQMAQDPRSSMPALLLGIKSYLRIEALLNLIDKRQPTFSEFITQYKSDLQIYSDFIYSKYKLAVNGIVKSDMPSSDDIVAFFWFTLFVVYQWSYINATGSIGSNPMRKEPQTKSFAYKGFAWNGVYGAVDQYPQYGVYQPSPPVPVSFAAPSYIIDIINTDNIVTDLQSGDEGGFMYGPSQSAILSGNIIPWAEGKLILGRMARWKAIYLNNGYDKLWSILQNLRALAGQAPLATPKLDQDGTIANGNWSVRELCTVLNVNGQFLDQFGQDYSLYALIEWLNVNALAGWAGAADIPYSGQTTTGIASGRPLSFRAKLAAAAV
jgi:hypothetical protein